MMLIMIQIKMFALVMMCDSDGDNKPLEVMVMTVEGKNYGSYDGDDYSGLKD